MKRLAFYLLSAAGEAMLVWWGIDWGAINGPSTTLHYTKLGSISDQMGYKAVAFVMLMEETGGAAPNKYGGNVTMTAERGTDTLSLKVDRSASKLLVLSGADVRFGTMNPEEMAIVRDDDNALVAIQTTTLSANVFALRLDRLTGNAVWGKVGDILGTQSGWIQYLECR